MVYLVVVLSMLVLVATYALRHRHADRPGQTDSLDHGHDARRGSRTYLTCSSPCDVGAIRRYSERRSSPKIFAARLLLPPTAERTR